MASMYVNDSHSPSPKGAHSHLLKYPKVGKGEEHVDISKAVEYSIQHYRQWCMTCFVGQRPGRKMIEDWEKEGLWKRDLERHKGVSTKC